MAPVILSQFVEQFHLLFLAFLGRKVDKAQYALKGGCNLRFFLGSIRYSEDMDLDAGNLERHVLRDRVNGILASAPFSEILRARGIAIEHINEHKQTDTTQRWKLGLRVDGVAVALPTKLEFSRRGMADEVSFESVDPIVIRGYHLPPVMANHYTADAAFGQKLGALASRSVTQARDIFDLHHLLMSGPMAAIGAGNAAGRPAPGGKASRAGAFDPALIDKARTNAMAIDFRTFKSQVLGYLPPDARATYDSKSTWETMVLEVVEALDRAEP
jgi:predicted nucleotidyltransferase component of viral defense system